jgi:hypothetical protein
MLADIRIPWWFSGGWAIDLFLGGSLRTHEDLDVGCFRHDVGCLFDVLRGWDFRAPVDHTLVPIDRSAPVPPGVHNIWCRPRTGSCWVLEVLVENSERDEWVYRRNPRIRRPREEIVDHTAIGLRFLRPEIQLLYKAKSARARDDADFEAAWRHLAPAAQNWLKASIAATFPGHPWLLTDRA